MKKYQLENSEEFLVGVHKPSVCKGQPCTIHNRTDHHMRSWPQHWRGDRKMMERICPHGVGHPDPDERVEINTTHGCDGCCIEPKKRKAYLAVASKFKNALEDLG